MGQTYEGCNFMNFEFVPCAYYLLKNETQKQFMKKIENILQGTDDIYTKRIIEIRGKSEWRMKYLQGGICTVS